MGTKNYRIRVSEFVELILDNDAEAFGFIKKNDTPNINLFLNKLIPNLLRARKQRRNAIHETIDETLAFYKEKIDAEHIRGAIDTVIDKVYFSTIDLQRLDGTICIRPHNDCQKTFDEIIESETEITGLDMSGCIRSLLNEYCKQPLFARETITFQDELNVIHKSYYLNHVMHLTYKEKKYRVVVLQIIFGFHSDQHNYIICYDMKRNAICSFFLSEIRRPYVVKAKYEPSTTVLSILEDYLNDYIFCEKTFYVLEENENATVLQEKK